MDYNKISDNKVNKVEWRNNHSIAWLSFNSEKCKINDHSEMDYIITCEFNNGKAKVSDYESIMNKMVKTYDSSISDDVINSAMENGRTNTSNVVNMTDKITIKYLYYEEQVSIKAKDTYIIEMIMSKK